MAKNDLLFKILFAVELALLPLTVFSYLYLDKWCLTMFICFVFAVKVWLEIFKQKDLKLHSLIDLIGNLCVFSFLFIFLASVDIINVALSIVCLIFVCLYEVLKFAMYEKSMPETIDAVDYCYTIFSCLVLLGLALAQINETVANIGLYSLFLTCIVSVGYRVYFIFKYTGFVYNVKTFFSKIFRRK